MEVWKDFFAAELGAAAALAGLVIVGISINVTRILSHPLLPGRAAETLVTPTGILVAASFGLVPVQPHWLLGIEWLATGAAMCLVPAIIQIRAFRSGAGRRLLPRALLAQFSALPFTLAGASLLLRMDGAVYWTVPGVVVSLIATMINAWVVMVEILR